MKNKRSGLADSPLFKVSGGSDSPQKSVVQVYEGSDEQMSERVNEQTSGGSEAGLSESGFEQTHKDTKAHGYRSIHRFNADLYLDQIEYIEDLTKRRRRVLGKSVSKGEILREIVDFYVEKKK